jgi:hypothetical protein
VETCSVHLQRGAVFDYREGGFAELGESLRAIFSPCHSPSTIFAASLIVTEIETPFSRSFLLCTNVSHQVF